MKDARKRRSGEWETWVMAESARQEHEPFGSDVVRRLVARPIRVEAGGRAAAIVDVIATAQPVAVEHDETEPAEVDAEFVDDLARLKVELQVMKAVVDAERRHNAQLRSRGVAPAEAAPLSEEGRLVRDRWAALVDQLLRAPR